MDGRADQEDPRRGRKTPYIKPGEYIEHLRSKAFRAGLKPHEFWELTPYETEQFIEETMKGRLTLAWMVAALSGGKKLPSKPELLWGEGGEQMVLDAKVMAAGAQMRAEAEKPRNPKKTRRRKRGRENRKPVRRVDG